MTDPAAPRAALILLLFVASCPNPTGSKESATGSAGAAENLVATATGAASSRAEGWAGLHAQAMASFHAGRWKEAQAGFRLAIGSLGADAPDDERRAASLSGLAGASRELGEIEAAIGHFEAAQKILEARPSSKDTKLAVVLHDLALLKVGSDPDAARLMLDTAIEIHRASSDARLEAKALNSLGTIELARVNLKAAKKALEQALARLDGVKESDLDRAIVSFNLGRVERSLGKQDEAEKRLLQSIQLFESLGPSTSRQVLAVLLELSFTYSAQGKLEKELELLEQRVAQAEALAGASSILAGRARMDLALGWFNRNELERVLAEYKTCLPIWKTFYGAEHGEVGLLLSQIATTEETIGQIEAAILHYELALPIMRKALGEDEKSVNSLETHLGALKKAVATSTAGR